MRNGWRMKDTGCKDKDAAWSLARNDEWRPSKLRCNTDLWPVHWCVFVLQILLWSVPSLAPRQDHQTLDPTKHKFYSATVAVGITSPWRAITLIREGELTNPIKYLLAILVTKPLKLTLALCHPYHNCNLCVSVCMLFR